MNTDTLVKQLCDLNAPAGCENLSAEKLKSFSSLYVIKPMLTRF